MALASSLLCAGNANAQSATPEIVIKNFYNDYVRPVVANKEILGKNSTLRKYLSAQLTIQKIKAFERRTEADYFVQSQEWSDEWENKFTISKPVIKGVTASAIVTFPGEYPRVKVTLVKEKGEWKIAAVQNAQL